MIAAAVLTSADAMRTGTKLPSRPSTAPTTIGAAPPNSDCSGVETPADTGTLEFMLEAPPTPSSTKPGDTPEMTNQVSPVRP